MKPAAKIECKFCLRRFSSDQRMISHMCEQKRRHNDRNSVASRIAFYAYCEIFKMTTRGNKIKTFFDFATSNLYKILIKFSRAVIMLDPINLDAYIHYLIKNSIKIKNWPGDATYLQFVSQYLMLEPPLVAFERSFKFIVNWGEQYGVEYNLFFKKVTPEEAVVFIRGGRISPWMLYLSSSSLSLIESFTDEQTKMVMEILDPTFWEERIAARVEDAVFIGSTLSDVGF